MATTPTTTTPPSTPTIYGPLNIDYLNESWCELQYKSGCSSTGSISHLNHSVNPEVLEKLLQEAQKESGHQSPAAQILPLFAADISASTSIITQDKLINSSSTNIIPTHAITQLNSASSTMKISTITSTINSTSTKSENMFIPIKSSQQSSTMYVYDEDDIDSDDIDLNYVEDDDEDEENNEQTNSSSVDLVASEEESMIVRKRHQKSTSNTINNNNNNNTYTEHSLNTECSHCLKHKQEIDSLIEKQLSQQKEIIRLRNDYELKLLNKSLELSQSKSTTSSKFMSSSPSPISPSSGLNTPNAKLNGENCGNSSSSSSNMMNPQKIDTKDWMKYFASRPQSQPPKEWNLVHPNSMNSQAANKRQMEQVVIAAECVSNGSECSAAAKLLGGESKISIGKLIFTHVASFIVGATLMFFVLRKHFNVKGSVYFI